MTTAAQLQPAPTLRAPIARPAADPIAWGDWQVVSRAHGFHVSRESIDGTRREFLLNDVREVKIFRSGPAAIRACEEANFNSRAARLARDMDFGRSAA